LIDIEEQLEKFEEAWQSDVKPRLLDFLPGAPIEFFDLLIELIKIDMEYRWRRAPQLELDSSRENTVTIDELPWRPTIEDYRLCLAIDSLEKPPVSLIAEEYRVRRRWGDSPTHKSFHQRYQHAEELSAGLNRVDTELDQRNSFLERPAVKYQKLADKRLFVADVQAGDRLDDFQILTELGHGAFARVFLAQQLSMQRFVALKISDEQSHESPVLAQLDHPNIVRVYDERTMAGLHLVYMQYVAGGNLRGVMNKLAKRGSPPRSRATYLASVRSQANRAEDLSPAKTHSDASDWPATVAWIGAQLADALAHAHSKGIVHSDIKPENILLSTDGRPLLADFNLSFGESAAMARSKGRFGGTLEFMSPEQLEVLQDRLKPDKVGAASDLYSLALVLRCLLEGKSPFPEPEAVDSYRATLANQTEYRRTPAKLGNWSDDRSFLGELLDEAMAFDPKDRPNSATWLYRRLLISRFSSIHRLLRPSRNSIFERVSKYPVRSLLAAGLFSSALMSPLNIWANHTIAIEGFDRDFFHNVEEPAVNMILFPAGVLFAWLCLRVISRALNHRGRQESFESERRNGAIRCLKFPWVMFVLVLILWSSSGLIFPLWNLAASGSHIDAMDVFGFFISQFLHGLIAACLAMFLLCWISLGAIYPKLISPDENREEFEALNVLDQRLNRIHSILEVTPMFALLAIAVSEQLDRRVFVALAFLGFIGHVVATNFAPRIHEWIRSYRLALGPTAELAKIDA
jgi:serine/threonine protein kinase